MANFNMQITNRGRALQAKAQAGTPLVFTRMRIGSGSMSGQQIADMTALIEPKLWLSINKSVASSSGKYTVGAFLSNENVTTGFYFREWGVFAQDPDLGEILYCYGNVGAGAEYISADGGSDTVEKQMDAITIIGNATNVSAVIDESLVLLSKNEFTSHQKAAVLDHPDGSVTTAKLADGASTDDKIGNRTITDATAPTSNTGKLTGLLSGLANMIKSITGGSTWRTAPGMTIAAIKTILDTATNAATANTLIKRDANGRAKVAAPSATDDIARKAEVDAAISTAAADATSKANSAQNAAISAAASDATSKANAAQAAAISAAALDASSKVDAHASDTVKHITASERTNWNAKETTTGAQTKANAARDAAISAAATDATSKANAVQSNLNEHKNDTNVHITSSERAAWNAKASTNVATTSTNGLMSSSDKTKLNGIATGANNYVHPTGAGNNHIPTGGASGNYLKWSASGTATWSSVSWGDVTGKPSTFAPSSHDHNDILAINNARSIKPSEAPKGYLAPYFVSLTGLNGTASTDYHDLLILNTYHDTSGGSVNALAFDKKSTKIIHFQAGQSATAWGTGKTLAYDDVVTTSSNGLMSSADKTKLNGIATGANNYVHPSTHPATMIVEDASHRFVTDSEKAVWNAKASTSVATTSANGLMSSADKTKLNGIATGANNYVHPSTHPPSIIAQDASNRFVTDAEKSTWNAKFNTTGGTFTGNITVPATTSYTSRLVRNTYISTSTPSGGSNGDIWIQYNP